MHLDLLDACDHNHRLANFAFLGTSITGAAYESRDVWMTHCGFPAREFNTCFLKAPGQRHDESIALAESWFEQASLPFMVRLRADLEDACAASLLAAGYERDEEETPVMALGKVPDAPPRVSEGLEIRYVETPEDLARFQTTTMEGFGFPGEAGHLFITPEFHARPGVRLFLACVDNEPVATSALVATDDTAGIYFVATKEGHRGRGYGEAVTWAAVCGGREFRCTTACLQASEVGRPVYERMGFETPTHYIAYAKPDAEGEAKSD